MEDKDHWNRGALFWSFGLWHSFGIWILAFGFAVKTIDAQGVF